MINCFIELFKDVPSHKHNAVAGEKFKTSTVYYAVKWEQVDVPDEEGHLVAALEAKGISRNMEGNVW